MMTFFYVGPNVKERSLSVSLAPFSLLQCIFALCVCALVNPSKQIMFSVTSASVSVLFLYTAVSVPRAWTVNACGVDFKSAVFQLRPVFLKFLLFLFDHFSSHLDSHFFLPTLLIVSASLLSTLVHQRIRPLENYSITKSLVGSYQKISIFARLIY